MLVLRDGSLSPYLMFLYLTDDIEATFTGHAPAPCANQQIALISPANQSPMTYSWAAQTDTSGTWADLASKDYFLSYWSITLLSPTARNIKLFIRHDEGLGVWQNGVQIIDNPAIDSVGSASSAIPIDAGSTNFVFRLLETRGSNVFAVKVTDEAGNPFSDVRYALNSCDQSSGTVFSDRVLSPVIAQDFSLRIVRGRPLLTFASPGRFDAP
jgi:hypothetical protein